MKYMLLIYANETAAKAVPKADVDKVLPAYAAYTEAMAKAGVLNGGNRLQWTDAATTVRATNGKTQVLDGPYAETKEQLGGYYLIDVADLAQATEWARKVPIIPGGKVVIRPVGAH